MSTDSNRLQPALQNLLQCVVQFFQPRLSCMTHTSAYIFWRTKSLVKAASDVAENLQLYRVVWFFHQRSSYTTTHISADVRRITLNASCMTISGGRTKQLDIFCHITSFKSDFLCFIVVELIRFFHGALQLS